MGFLKYPDKKNEHKKRFSLHSIGANFIWSMCGEFPDAATRFALVGLLNVCKKL